MTESRPQDPQPIVVLDTNAVLDWLVFGDPGMGALSQAVRAREVRWAATTSMRDELGQVLGRPALATRAATRPDALAAWDALADVQPEPPTQPWRCRDADDQVFLDLALAVRACWLVTRDRALLELARKTALAGTHIIKPSDWAPDR